MKVIICIDDSLFTEPMIKQIIQRRWHENTEFKLLTVLEPISMSPDPRMTEFITLKREREANKKLKAWRQLLIKEIPRSIVHMDVRHGGPVQEILNAAVEWNAEKIIMGAHNKGINPKLNLGSVSGSVVKQALCTVEILRESENPVSCS